MGWSHIVAKRAVIEPDSDDLPLQERRHVPFELDDVRDGGIFRPDDQKILVRRDRLADDFRPALFAIKLAFFAPG